LVEGENVTILFVDVAVGIFSSFLSTGFFVTVFDFDFDLLWINFEKTLTRC
jgi:hypothetical protein